VQRAVTDEAGVGKEVEKDWDLLSSQFSVEVLRCQNSAKNLFTSSRV